MLERKLVGKLKVDGHKSGCTSYQYEETVPKFVGSRGKINHPLLIGRDVHCEKVR